MWVGGVRILLSFGFCEWLVVLFFGAGYLEKGYIFGGMMSFVLDTWCLRVRGR